MVLFKQQDFRKFQFDFLLTPDNQSETDNIVQIIYQLRLASVPEVATGSLGRFFIPPCTVDIDFLHNGKINNYIPAISTCFIESVAVDYAPGGEWVAHYDGSPKQIRLTISLIEIEIMTRDKID